MKKIILNRWHLHFLLLSFVVIFLQKSEDDHSFLHFYEVQEWGKVFLITLGCIIASFLAEAYQGIFKGANSTWDLLVKKALPDIIAGTISGLVGYLIFRAGWVSYDFAYFWIISMLIIEINRLNKLLKSKK